MRLLLWAFALFAVSFAEETVVEENVVVESENVEIEATDSTEIKEEQQEEYIEYVEDIGELQKMIDENEYVLAYFFHPACIPCMEFSETFNELPQALEDLEWAQNIELVQINMGADTERIKEMYNIEGYPWINFYKNGRASRYQGRRHIPKLVKFMARRILYSFRHVETLDAAEALKEKYNEDTQVLCLGYYPEGDANISTLEYASDDFDLVTMAATFNADVAKVFGIERHGTYIFKQSMPGRIVEMEGEMTKETLSSFLENFGKPLVQDYTEEHTMVIFNKDQAHHIFLLLPDPTNEEEETKYAKILDNFIEFAAKVEQAGHGKDTLFMVADADNPDNYRLVGFFDVVPDELPTYRISHTATGNRWGRRVMKKKEWQPDRLFEVFENALAGNEKFQLAEGAPENFYEMEPLYLTTAVFEQNIAQQKPHLVLFHHGGNEREMELLKQIAEAFPLETYKKKKRGYPRITEFNIKKNYIIASSSTSVLRGKEVKAGEFWLFRGLETMVKYEGPLVFDTLFDWTKEKAKKKLHEGQHDEL
ncbi:Oidioi.mRNA.OKI2018_I69.chr2.g5945.t1.cds [Oikopleura dioica]|uniref:Oidioi.mRNA.OKI2018_I69.chr2.g5945.t1.cds n=1 Tax=Oikopleura dioica TaxID=34765 RepID=A0ABN7T1F0_OIKDI|nr:Oidioi.mRNA.OKI2018_I69.chr2.g5945.t1.cds [Oikopleura dioica]